MTNPLCQCITQNTNYKLIVKALQMVTAMTVGCSNWYSHLQWKSIDLKEYFRRVHGCTAMKVLWMTFLAIHLLTPHLQH